MQVEKECRSVGLKEDHLNRARWRVGFGEIAVSCHPRPVYGYKPESNLELNIATNTRATEPECPFYWLQVLVRMCYLDLQLTLLPFS